MKKFSEEYGGLNLFAWTVILGAKERHDIDGGIKIQNVSWKVHTPIQNSYIVLNKLIFIICEV